jgi:hypothetical protein
MQLVPAIGAAIPVVFLLRRAPAQSESREQPGPESALPRPAASSQPDVVIGD